MASGKNVIQSSLENLPNEVILGLIFPYLNAEDIFNVGEPSKKMKNLVVYNIRHPLSTELQYLKIKKRFFKKENSPYDNVECFRNMEKCLKTTCKC